ncbi:hypothetical protein EV401DRAFT_1863930, partial [Pisolithus croceorrhizus]
PVICSAATLVHAISDYQCIIPWLHMNNSCQIPSRVVPWFNCWFMLKMKGEPTLVILTIVGRYTVCRGTCGWVHLMYLQGTLFASCHLILAPDITDVYGVRIGCCIRKIVDSQMDTRGALRLFLQCHTFRILMVDIPAFFASWKHSGMLLQQCFTIHLWLVD